LIKREYITNFLEFEISKFFINHSTDGIMI